MGDWGSDREPLPIHALLGLWQAQITGNEADFRLIAETIGTSDLQGGAMLSLLHLVNRDGPDVINAFTRLMQIGKQTILIARSSQVAGFMPAEAAVTAQNFAIEILTGTSIANDGIMLSVSMSPSSPLMTAIGVLVPINVAASNITSLQGVPDLITVLRSEFWAIENSLNRH